MPSATSRARTNRANQRVGFPDVTPRRTGGDPSGIEPSIVSRVSPGNHSGQSSAVEPAGPVVAWFTTDRSPAGDGNSIVAAAFSAGPPWTTRAIAVSPRFRAPATAPE